MLPEEKKQGWISLGEKFNQTEMALQAQAQSLQQGVDKLPQSIDEILDAEVFLEGLVKSEKQVKASRMVITKAFDDLSDRLMLPEKSFQPHIKAWKEKIVELKKQAQEIKEKADKRDAILRGLVSTVQRVRAEHHSLNEQRILDYVNLAYSYALSSGKVNKENLQEYIRKCSDKKTIDDFSHELTIGVPEGFSQEFQKIASEIYNIDPEAYLRKFRLKLNEAFLLFETDLLNKEQAIKDAEIEKALQEEKTKIEENNSKLAAQLQERASVLTEEPEFKPLKKSYEVAMPVNQDSMVKIVMAFAANLDLLQGVIKARNLFNLDVNQMAKALCDYKISDPNFQPQDIIFKEVNKL